MAVRTRTIQVTGIGYMDGDEAELWSQPNRTTIRIDDISLIYEDILRQDGEESRVTNILVKTGHLLLIVMESYESVREQLLIG